MAKIIGVWLLEKLGVASMAELMRLNYWQALDGGAAPPK